MSARNLPRGFSTPREEHGPWRKRAAVVVGGLALLLIALLLAGCGPKEGDEHGEGDGHGHGEETPSGASFKAGKGVSITDETRKILGLELAEVDERKLEREIRFTVQVFGEKHHHLLDPENHAKCDTHGSGFLPDSLAVSLAPEQRVEFPQGGDAPLVGEILSVKKTLTLGESEVVVGIFNATTKIKAGAFIPARIAVPRNAAVAVVPESALLRTAEGSFVYAVNGSFFYRTAVRAEPPSEGWVAIADGLLAGDQVVTKPVETLWLIELRATKGGGHSH